MDATTISKQVDAVAGERAVVSKFRPDGLDMR